MKAVRSAGSSRSKPLLASALVAIGLALLASPASSRAADSPQAGASIVNGQATSIKDWPWQVAIIESRRLNPLPFVRQRFLCGGSALTPRLIITAAHCVADLRRSEIRNLQVVSGRSRLNADVGQIVRVSGLRMPVNSRGKRRFRPSTTAWDVALLTLQRPISATPIKLAGPDEAEVWAPGAVVTATGWGITRHFRYPVAFHLRRATHVMLGNGVCDRQFKRRFKPGTMTCVGGPGGHSSTCNGDSGGPLVARTSDGYRLVGLTSWGVSTCRGTAPSVFASPARNPMRDWIRTSARNLTGIDVVGSGATPLPHPNWCHVPALRGLTVSQARNKIQAAGCRLGHVLPYRKGSGSKGRVRSASRLPGWYSRPGTSIHLWVRR